uniref:Cytochrome c oxidase subunit 6C n=1 Tax=Salvator merianae TaxID=96440 RepID=A0A8D0BG38_SALMN
MSSALLARPEMRGLLAKRMRKHLIISVICSSLVAVSYKFFVAEPRKRAYAEFYKNYDPMKEFEAMKNAGVLESAKPK